MLKFSEHIFQAKSKQLSTASVFLDLKKAFDTVNHKLLLYKLQKCGVQGKALEWFKNYLTNRTQQVQVGQTISGILKITCGVPQGSILGPLLFLIFINDLPLNTKMKTILFADDTTFQLTTNSDKLIPLLNEELEKARIWFENNKLTLHPDKTKVMLTNYKQKAKVVLNNTELERIGKDETTKSFKFVGIHVDEDLDWSHHVRHIANKIRKIKFSLSRLNNFMPKLQKGMVYNALFKPHIEYGIEVWGGAKPSILKPLKIMQNQCLRFVCSKKRKSHTNPLYKEAETLKLEDIYVLRTQIQVLKVLQGTGPEALTTMIAEKTSDRSKRYHVLEVPNNKYKTDTIMRLPSMKIPNIWNEQKHSHAGESIKKFKTEFKERTLGEYSRKCTKRHCHFCSKV